MTPATINAFDGVIGTLALLAAVMGLRTGLLRSVATIAGYVAAAPLAYLATPRAIAFLAERSGDVAIPDAVVICSLAIVGGVTLGTVFRMLVQAVAGPTVGVVDRLGGAVFGAARIGLVAVVLVLVFDRMIPRGQEPDFLAQSRLRPILASAGAAGLKSLPPEIDSIIDRVKRDFNL